jgi:hypothetical protein
MPTPAETLKACRDRLSTRLEETAKRNAATAPTLSNVLDGPVRSAAGREALAAIRAILKSPRPHPKAWAWKLKAKEQAGVHLSSMQMRLWREALAFKEETIDEDL